MMGAKFWCTALALAIGAGGGADAAQPASAPAAEPQLIDVGNVESLGEHARRQVMRKHQNLHSTLVGEELSKLRAMASASGKIEIFSTVDLNFKLSEKDKDCARINMTIVLHEVMLKDGGTQPVAQTYTMNMCPNGKPPRSGAFIDQMAAPFQQGANYYPIPKK